MSKKKKDPKNVKKGRAARSRGARYERKVRDVLSEWWGSEFTRTPQSGGFATKQFRDNWNAAGDVVTPDDTFPFSVECKNQEDWEFEKLLTAPKNNLFLWWEQTYDQTDLMSKIPLLVFTKNYKPDFFMMAEVDWPVDQMDKVVRVRTPLASEYWLVIGRLHDLIETNPERWRVDDVLED